MIRYLFSHELACTPGLHDSMFRDRTRQFRDRLGWDVQVDADGHERDQYDALDPLYVIWQRPDGQHGGSMRFLPTIGRTMVNEHFLHLTNGQPIRDPGIWECTRFCLAPDAGGQVAAALMLAGGEIMTGFNIRQFVGVFDARMERIYRRIGSEPRVFGSAGAGRGKTSVGLWSFSDDARARVANAAGITPDQSRAWFADAFLSRAA